MASETTDIERSLYAFLHDEEDARACRGITEAACRVVPGNYVRMVIALVLTKAGDAIVNAKSVLPWLLGFMGVPAGFAAVLVPLRESGSMLPQLALGGWIRGHRRRKGFFVAGCLLQGAATLGLALAAFTLSGSTGGVAIVTCLVVFSLARGLCSIAQKDVIGKTIPKAQRGMATGIASSLAGATAIGIALWLWFTQESIARYVAMLLGGAGLWFAAAAVFAAIDEYAGATDGGRNGIADALGRLRLLREDAVFRRFLLARALLTSSALMAPYLVLLAREQTAADLAFFLLAQGLASLLSGPFWGRFADSSAPRVMVLSGLGVALLGGAVVLARWFGGAADLLYPLAFFLLALLHDGVRLGRKTYAVDIASGDRRTDYVAVGNTLIGVLLLLTMGLGAVAEAVSVGALIALLAVLALAGAAVAARLPDADALDRESAAA